MRLLVGSDPELFVKKEGRFISGHIFRCGSKKNPLVTPHGSVQVDGVALECNVRPSETIEEFQKNFENVLQDLDFIVKVQDPTCTLHAVPTVNFGLDYIGKLPRWVQNLGCNVDFSAYTGEANEKPSPYVPFRTGGGHVHLGWTEGKEETDYTHFQECCRLARQLDFYLGLPSLSWDSDSERRKLYGKPGAFRPKPYGMEYRSLSNAWVFDRELRRRVFSGTKRAFYRLFKDQKEQFLVYGEFAKEIIEKSDTSWRQYSEYLSEEIL